MRDYHSILREQKNVIENVLVQSFLVDRELREQAQAILSSRLVKVITGVRRCGKSTFALQLLAGKGSFGYVNFDDEKLVGIDAQELNVVLQTVYEVYGKFSVLILDEVQNVTGWELFVNRLQREGKNLIVTGSNAKLLSRELATHLTGRQLSLELFPFSFAEFLKAKGIGAVSGELTEERGIMQQQLRLYLEGGGFPEVLREPKPAWYLQQLYDTIITKDVLLRYRIRKARTFRDMAMYLMTNFARELSFNRLKKTFQLGSDHTAKNYVGYLEETYLIFLVERFSYKKRQSLVENRKVYGIDTGLLAAVGTQYNTDWSHLYENMVALELLRRKARTQNFEFYYWKNPQQEEVDFVLKQGMKVTCLIQVCYEFNQRETKTREVRALLKASRELRCESLVVITKDYEGREAEEWFGLRGEVVYVPLWKWLLSRG